jgi:hypothetical protein
LNFSRRQVWRIRPRLFPGKPPAIVNLGWSRTASVIPVILGIETRVRCVGGTITGTTRQIPVCNWTRWRHGRLVLALGNRWQRLIKVLELALAQLALLYIVGHLGRLIVCIRDNVSCWARLWWYRSRMLDSL